MQNKKRVVHVLQWLHIRFDLPDLEKDLSITSDFVPSWIFTVEGNNWVLFLIVNCHVVYTAEVLWKGVKIGRELKAEEKKRIDIM